MSEDTPTQRFDAQPVAADPGEPRRKSRLALILGIVGGVLLLVVILLVILLLRGQGTPQAAGTNSPITTTTPSVTPSATTSPSSTAPAPPPPHTTAPPPPPSGPGFSSFAAPATETGCQAASPSYPAVIPNIKVSWAAVNAKSVWIVQGTSDAADSGFMQLPLSGNQSNFPYPIMFECSQDSNTYTMTIVGTNGMHVSKSWTVLNKGDKF